MYSVNGRTVATAATANHVVWAAWNPHASQRVRLVSFFMFANTAPTSGWAGRLRRITTRGTPGSTVTPDISTHSTRGIAPPSGTVLDLAAYAAQPSLDTIDLGIRFTFAAVIGSGFVYPIPGGIELPPGAGLAFIQIPAVASPVFETGFSFLEDW